MKKYIKISVLILILVMLSLCLFLSISRHGAKNYVYSRNSQAEQLFKYFGSSRSLFNEYLKNHNVPNTKIVFMNGKNTDNDCIIEANQYCNKEESISKELRTISQIDFYWTIKIVNGSINEIWVYSKPLHQSQLKQYSFEEQVSMVPLFNNGKFQYKSEYVIGYFNQY